MEYVIVIGATSLMLAYFVVRRLISKAYHRGWMNGFDDAVVIYETGDEVVGELVEIVAKELAE